MDLLSHPSRTRRLLIQWGCVVMIGLLVVVSLMVGVAEGSSQVFGVSHIPRTVAVLLTGSALALAGFIMQSVTRNRFVEPSTVGSTEAAALGLLGMAIFLPGAPMWMKVLIAALAAGMGLRVKTVERLAVLMVATVAAVTVAVVGMLPFVGLIVPNIARSLIGDNARTALPWVAILGATLTLTCDIFARVVIYPLELPIGSVLGVVGAALFLIFLLRFAYNDKGVAS